MSIDLEAELKAIDGYDKNSGSRAKARIRSAFAELQLLEPQLQTYKEIAERQAREIVQMGVALSAGNGIQPELAPRALKQMHETVIDALATHDALVAAREHGEGEQ